MWMVEKVEVNKQVISVNGWHEIFMNLIATDVTLISYRCNLGLLNVCPASFLPLLLQAPQGKTYSV
jgi:hypothetical protein